MCGARRRPSNAHDRSDGRFLLACVIEPAPDRHGPGRSSSSFEALRPASRHPLGQRGTVRRNGRGRTVSWVGGSRPASRWSASAGPAPAERTARAHASDLEGRTAKPLGRECPGRSASTASGHQRQPSPRGAWPAAACGVRVRPSPDYPERGQAVAVTCAGCAPTGPSWGGYLLDQRAAEGPGMPRPDSGDWIGATCLGIIDGAGRKSFMASAQPGRAAPKPNKLANGHVTGP